MGGWIKIHRDITQMKGYFDGKFSRAMCWIDLLLLAEWRDERVFFIRGIKVSVKRGQIAISIEELSKRWKLAKLTCKNRLDEFVSDGKIDIQRSNVINLISILNYEKYQSIDTQTDLQINLQTDLPIKNIKNIKDNREGKSGKSEKRFSPPSIEEVGSYIREKGYTVDAERFVNFYESKGWYIGKNKMKNWRAAVATWQKEDNKRNGINQQRSCDKRRGTEATATRPEDYEGKF